MSDTATHIKLSAAQRGTVLAAGAQVIRSLQAQVSELNEKLASAQQGKARAERELEVRTIADDMEARGLNEHLSYEEKVASLRAHSNLELAREAVKMASSDSSLALAVATDEISGGNDGYSILRDFVLS